MANQADKKAPQDWLGLSILVSIAIFAALFVLSQVAQLKDDSSRQLQANESQPKDLRDGTR